MPRNKAHQDGEEDDLTLEVTTRLKILYQEELPCRWRLVVLFVWPFVNLSYLNHMCVGGAKGRRE